MQRGNLEHSQGILLPPNGLRILPMSSNQSTGGSDPAGVVHTFGSFSITFQGKLAIVKHHRYNVTPKRGKKKTPISWFSFSSRRRLLRKFAAWDFDTIGRTLFITLTYPDEIPLPDQETRNRHRYIFHRHFEHYYNVKIPSLWRLEWEERKSGKNLDMPYPHWHMLFFGVRFIAYQHINEVWRKIIGAEGYVRTEIIGSYGQHTAPMYIGKYLSKIRSIVSLVYGSYHNMTGRHWGVLREKIIPKCEATEVNDVTEDEKNYLLHFANEYFDDFPQSGCQSFTILGKDAEELRKEFQKIRLGKDLAVW